MILIHLKGERRAIKNDTPTVVFVAHILWENKNNKWAAKIV